MRRLDVLCILVELLLIYLLFETISPVATVFSATISARLTLPSYKIKKIRIKTDGTCSSNDAVLLVFLLLVLNPYLLVTSHVHLIAMDALGRISV